jgi:hypothetical protein
MAKALEPYSGERDATYADRFACRPSLDRIFNHADEAAALDLAMYDAFEHHGYTLREIGEFVRRPADTVWRRIRRAQRRVACGTPVENAKIEI